MFLVNISSKEMTRFSFTRGEQHGVTASRANSSLAWREVAALFSTLFSQGAAVLFLISCIVQEGNLREPRGVLLSGSPGHKLIYFTPSKSMRTVCRAAARLVSAENSSRARDSSSPVAPLGGFLWKWSCGAVVLTAVLAWGGRVVLKGWFFFLLFF